VEVIGNRATLPTLAASGALPKSGPFPPPTLLGFYGTTSLSATPHGPACPSRASGWEIRLPPLGFPVLRGPSLCRHAVASTPVATREGMKSFPLLSSRLRPSPSLCWVGCHIMLFEACTAFTFVTACLLAESLYDPFHRRLRQYCCLHCRSDRYRLERPVAGWELHPLKGHALARRTRGTHLMVRHIFKDN